jgi:hypothetical protein
MVYRLVLETELNIAAMIFVGLEMAHGVVTFCKFQK